MYHAIKFAQLPSNKSLEDVVPAMGLIDKEDAIRIAYQNASSSGSIYTSNYQRMLSTIETMKKRQLVKDTWNDWHLIPNERPSFQPPAVKTNYQGLDGTDTVIDLTTAVAGYVPHDRREGSWEWHVVNDYGHWATRYSQIMNFLQQREVVAILEDDAGYCYRGRFSVNQWRSDPERSKIVIDYSVLPHKYEVLSSNNLWLWDPFSFETGVIRTLGQIAVSGTSYATIVGSPSPWQPSFVFDNVTSDTFTVKDEFHNVERTLTKAEANSNYEFVFSNIVLRPLETDITGTYSDNTSYQDDYGNNRYRFKFTGNGNVLIKYRGGSL